MSGAEQSSLDIGPESHDGTTPRRSLLPTPRATDGAHGGPNESWGLTSYAAGSHASLSRTPADDSPRTMPDGSGPSSLGSFAYYDHDSSSWRTLQGSLLEEWATFSENWPRAGTTRSGIASRRQPSVPLTSVTESLSLPTPTATPYGSNQSPSPGAAVRPSLQTMAKREMWHTPTASDKDGRPRWDHRASPGYVRAKPVPNLMAQVLEGRIPTPTARDGRTLKGAQDRRRDGGPSLAQVALDSGATSGSLNPTWVEWLMGFPLGWTDSVPSVTRSSRKSRSGSEGDS